MLLLAEFTIWSGNWRQHELTQSWPWDSKIWATIYLEQVPPEVGLKSLISWNSRSDSIGTSKDHAEVCTWTISEDQWHSCIAKLSNHSFFSYDDPHAWTTEKNYMAVADLDYTNFAHVLSLNQETEACQNNSLENDTIHLTILHSLHNGMCSPWAFKAMKD